MTWFRSDLIKVKTFQYDGKTYKGVISLIKIDPETILGCFDGKTEIFDVDENNIVIPRNDVDIKQSLHIYRYENKLVAYVPNDNSEYEGIDYINHSCHPNCYIDNIIIVKSKRLINPNGELTFDYRTSNLALEGSICNCKNKKKCYF